MYTLKCEIYTILQILRRSNSTRDTDLVVAPERRGPSLPLWLFVSAAFFPAALSLPAQTKPSAPSGRPVSVEDAIQMTQLADPDYFRGGDSKGHVALFSFDGKQFVVVSRKGNLE